MDLRNMKCICRGATNHRGNTCHTTEESQAIVVTAPTGSLGFISMLLLVNGAAPEVRVRVRARASVRVRVRVQIRVMFSQGKGYG